MTTSPFHHEKRKVFTPQERAKIFADAGEKCAKCTRKLGRGEDWDLDHIIALENGGTNEDSNLQVLCDWCHTPKTSDDHRAASKSKRVYTRQVVPARFRRSKSWR
jgi:5-methylcytosine-specific restriction protein A